MIRKKCGVFILPYHEVTRDTVVCVHMITYHFFKLLLLRGFLLYQYALALTLKVQVTTIDAVGTLNRIITAQWEGMGDVGLARYELALLPPCPTIRVLSYSNCQRSTHSISK